VNFAERMRMVRADRQQRDLRRHAAADFLEAVEVRAVSGVVDATSLMFQNEPAVTTMMIAQSPRAPMFARRQRHFPVLVTNALPPFQFNDAFEAKIERKVANSPRHDGNFRLRQSAKRGFVKVIEVRVGQEHQVDGRQVLNFQTRPFDAFQKEQPVREVRIDEHIQVGELNQERSVADPGDGDLSFIQFWKTWPLTFADAPREQSFPNHFMEEGAWIEML